MPCADCCAEHVQADKFLRSDGYRNYDFDSMREGKAACKAALQRVRSPLTLAAVRPHPTVVLRMSTRSSDAHVSGDSH